MPFILLCCLWLFVVLLLLALLLLAVSDGATGWRSKSDARFFYCSGYNSILLFCVVLFYLSVSVYDRQFVIAKLIEIMNNRMFLDIDDSPLINKLIIPENVQARETTSDTKQFDSTPFLIIQPIPGACIKTKTDSGEKVFLNVCTTDKIPPPKDISDEDLFQLLSEEAPSFSIPMSIGAERLESDKGGKPCPVFDIAINNSYFEKCQKKKGFWLFTISVIMDGVSNKFGKILNTENYVVLKNRKVTGKLQKHRIENREPRNSPHIQKPLIEEISCPLDGNFHTKKKEPSSENSKQNYVLLKQPLEGTPERLIGLFPMPKDITGKDVAVLLDPDRVVVAVDKTGLTYDITVPYVIAVANATSFLDKDIGVLRLNMPVKSIQSTKPKITEET